MYAMQIMLYFMWGNVLCAGSLSFSAICSQARPAVLVAVIWVIMSGFGANLVLTQFIEQGPSVAATILQIIPSMGLFRGRLHHHITSDTAPPLMPQSKSAGGSWKVHFCMLCTDTIGETLWRTLPMLQP